MVISPAAGYYHSRLGCHWCGGGGVVSCGVVLWLVGVVWCGVGVGGFGAHCGVGGFQLGLHTP